MIFGKEHKNLWANAYYSRHQGMEIAESEASQDNSEKVPQKSFSLK